MKKFRFRLERILQLKAHKEKDKQKNLALSSQKVFNQEEKLQDINTDRIETQTEQNKYLVGLLDSTRLSIYSRYYVRLKKSELAGKEILIAFKKEQDDKRSELVEATRDKKIYEKLKERQHDKYYEDLEREWQKEQDELASQIDQYKKRLPK